MLDSSSPLSTKTVLASSLKEYQSIRKILIYQDLFRESTFVDGGVHPRFGTRNFTLPLQNGQYIEVVCPLDHPATEQTPWGKAVSKKAQEGGGWLTWVFATDNISIVEEKFGRTATEGHRTRPDGTDLKWKQIGVNEITDSRELPFFIQWLTADHPSQDGKAVAAIEKITMCLKI